MGMELVRVHGARKEILPSDRRSSKRCSWKAILVELILVEAILVKAILVEAILVETTMVLAVLGSPIIVAKVVVWPHCCGQPCRRADEAETEGFNLTDKAVDND